MFGGFNSFYSPFGYYGGFYNPFGYGFRNGYRNNWGNRWNRFNDYYGDNLDQRNKRDYSSTVARINSGRGEKTYDNPKERTREKTENTDSKTRDIQNTLDRLNLGRGVNSTNRNLVIGYDRNRTGNNTNNLNSIRNIRPGGTFNSLTRDTRRTQLNTNLTKSPQGLSRASGRVQNQYSLVERNPDRFSSSRDRRPSSSQGVVSSRNSENSRSSARIVRQSNRNKTKNTSNYSNSRTRRSNNFSRSNNSFSNNRNSNRSYNSGGSGSAVRSGGSSGGRGRTN